MRILVVTSQFPVSGDPHRGRAVYQTVRELARIAQVQVAVPVAAYPRGLGPRSYIDHAAADGFRPGDLDVRYVRYPAVPVLSRPFNGWLCGRALGRALADVQADVVLSYWLYPDAAGAASWARRRGLPLVAGARGSDLRVRDAVSKLLTARVVRRADRLLLVSADLERIAMREHGAAAGRTAVISNGCDTAIFHPADRAQARAALGLPQERRLVAYVGRLVREKGLHELIEAVAALGDGTGLALVGDGPGRRQLEALAGSARATVRFAGAQPPEAVARWIAACDLLALPSWSEGYPNVLVEALACGRPVVATAVGGIPEIVDAGCGVLVPVRDAGALRAGLAAALARSWDESQLAARFGRPWRQVAAETLAQCELALRR